MSEVSVVERLGEVSTLRDRVKTCMMRANITRYLGFTDVKSNVFVVVIHKSAEKT